MFILVTSEALALWFYQNNKISDSKSQLSNISYIYQKISYSRDFFSQRVLDKRCRFDSDFWGTLLGTKSIQNCF